MSGTVQAVSCSLLAPPLIALASSEVHHLLAHLIWPAPRPRSFPVTGRAFGAPTSIGLAITIVAVARKSAKPGCQAHWTFLPSSSQRSALAPDCSGEPSWPLCRENFPEFSLSVVRLVLVLVAHRPRKE